MSSLEQQRSIDEFKLSATCNILLISLKAGGVGLNLVCANHLFLMDLWWNPAIELQAFDRIYRVGQTRPVYIHRLVIQDTVEQKLLSMQLDKTKLANGTLDEKRLTNNAQAIQKPTFNMNFIKQLFQL
jgi:SNF2 family DNA or RNA helicase